MTAKPGGVLVLKIIIGVLATIMLVQTAGMMAEGCKRFGTFGGAVLLMGASLAVIWNVIAGGLMFLARNRVRELVGKLPWKRTTIFFLFATTLALLEEVVTTTLTNLSNYFGSADGFITASRNYFEVVVWHSVIVIAPMFIVWALFLNRRRFSPAAVFLLFGINGVIAEMLIGGPALVMAPFWIFVYGLMVFLPAYSFRLTGETPAPRWFHYPAAVGACLIASAAVALIVNFLSPYFAAFWDDLVDAETRGWRKLMIPAPREAAGNNRIRHHRNTTPKAKQSFPRAPFAGILCHA